MIAPLRNVQGKQVDYNKFSFYWSEIAEKMNIKYIVIFMGGVPEPQIIPCEYCMNNRIEGVPFPDLLSPGKIERVSFLLYATDDQNRMPNLYELSRDPRYICNVLCGDAEIRWKWIKKKDHSFSLLLSANKIIPEHSIWYEYVFGGIHMKFYIEHEIKIGKSEIPGIYFPESLQETPELRASWNITLSKMKNKVLGLF